MRKISLFGALLFLVYSLCDAQPIFQKNIRPYFTPSSNVFNLTSHSMIPLSQGKLLVIGNSNQVGNTRMMVTTTDPRLTLQSSFHHGLESGDLNTYRSVKGPDGMVVTVGGFKNLAGTPDYYLYVNKMTTTGDLVWEKNLAVTGSSTSLTTAYDVVVQPDSSIVLCGVTGTTKRGVLVKLDKNGNVVWDRLFVGSSNFWFTRLIRHSSGDFGVVGIDNTTTFVARINASGNPVWMQKTATVNPTNECGIVQTQDGNLVFTGGSSISQAVLGKFDYNTGALLWHNGFTTTGSQACGFTVAETSIGDLIIGGRTYGATHYATMIRANSAGTFMSSRLFNATVNGGIRNIFYHPDGSMIAMSDTTVIKFKSTLLTCGGTSMTATTATLSTTTTALSPTITGGQVTPAPSTFANVRTPGWWKLSTDCGGKCTTVDNVAAAFYSSDQEICAGNLVTFTPVPTGASYLWKIDGFTTTVFPNYQFNTPGPHTVQLIANDGGTCKDTATTVINVTNCGAPTQPPGVVQARTGSSGAQVKKLLPGPPGRAYVQLSSYSSPTNTFIACQNAANTAMVWGKYFSNYVPFDMVRTQDYGYVAAAQYNGTVLLVKLDSAGTFLWSNNYRVVGTSAGAITGGSLIESSDGSLYFSGGTAYGPTGASPGWGFVVKTNSTGTQLWAKEFSSHATLGYTSIRKLLERPNGEIFMAGEFTLNGSNISGLFGKLNPTNGAVTMLKQYSCSGSNTRIYAITKTMDGKILIVGNQISPWLMKIDDNASVIWETRPYFPSYATTSHVTMTADSGFFMTSSGSGNQLTKLDKYGHVVWVSSHATAYGTNALRDANGNYWYNYDESGFGYSERFVGDFQVDACTGGLTSATYLPFTEQVKPFAFLSTTSNTFEDPQPLTQTLYTNTYTIPCTRAGCMTDARYLGPLEACAGVTYTYNNTSLLGSTYIWKVNGTPVSTSTNLSYAFPSPGAYILRLVATGAGGCSDSLQQTVNVSANITANAGTDVTIACGANTTLTGSGGTTYSWSPVSALSNPNSASPVANPLTTTSYVLSATTGYCTDLDTVVVTIAGTNVAITGADSICLGDPVTLTASGATSYVWSPGGQTTAAITVSPTVTTTYSVTGTYLTCNGTATHPVVVKPVPAAPTVGSNSPVLQGATLNLTASLVTGATYSWTGPNGFTSTLRNPSIPGVTAINAGTYTVTASLNGCPSSSSSTTVVVITTAAISGTILHPSGLSNVRFTGVAYTGPTSGNLITGTDGSYNFPSLTAGGNYTVTPSKANDSLTNNGVTTLDLVLMQRHILQQDTLNSPYKIIAADVNLSGGVTTLDIVLTRNVILQNTLTFPSGRLWNMVTADYVFPNVVLPWPFPSTRNYPAVSTQTNQNYYGIKLGDVNWSWNPNLSKTLTTGKLPVYFGESWTDVEGNVTVPVRVNRFVDMAGYQFTVEWDPTKLDYVSMEGGLTAAYAGEKYKAEGQLTVSWNDEAGALLTLPDGSILMFLKFSPAASKSFTTTLSINSARIEGQAYDANLDILAITDAKTTVAVRQSAPSIASGLIGCNPNPFSNATTIKFGMEIAGAATFVITDLSGKAVTRFGGPYAAGIHEVQWDGKDQAGEYVSAGTYLVTFATGDIRQTMRLVYVR